MKDNDGLVKILSTKILTHYADYAIASRKGGEAINILLKIHHFIHSFLSCLKYLQTLLL